MSNLVTRLDLTTWAAHIMPLLEMADTIRLAATGDRQLVNRLHSTCVTPIDHVSTMAWLLRLNSDDANRHHVPVTRMDLIPKGSRNMSIGATTILPQDVLRVRQDFEQRPSLHAMTIKVDRIALSDLTRLLCHCQNMQYLALYLTYETIGFRIKPPPLEIDSFIQLSQLKHLTIACNHSRAFRIQDAECLYHLPNLESLHAQSSIPSSIICATICGFKSLSSLRLDKISPYVGRLSFKVNDIPRTVTCLRLQFCVFYHRSWVHGKLPPNLTRLSLKSLATFHHIKVHDSTLSPKDSEEDNVLPSITECPDTLVRLSISANMANLLDRTAIESQMASNPKSIRSLTRMHTFSLHYPLAFKTDHEDYITCLPLSCTRLKLDHWQYDYATVLVRMSNSVRQLKLDLFQHNFAIMSPRTCQIESLAINVHTNFDFLGIHHDLKHSRATTIHITYRGAATTSCIEAIHATLQRSPFCGWFIYSDRVGQIIYNRSTLVQDTTCQI